MTSTRVGAALRDRDLAVGYGLIVTGVCLGLTLSSGSTVDDVVARTSTNLANLHQHPLFVLVTSAFVEPSPSELWLVVLLVVVCGAAQRRLGRTPTLVTLVLGHVGATLFVAAILGAGVAHGTVGRSVTHAQDVGVSYALVAVAGLLSVGLRRPWSAVYVAVLTVGFLTLALVSATFTDLGHLTAWVIGLSLAAVARAAGRSAPAQ